jgi:hypothetical protein
MRTRVACLLVVAIVATGVAFALTRPGRHVEGSGRDLAAPYFAIVWLPRGESHARAELVREQCGSARGAASVSARSRSHAVQTAHEFVFSIKMRWGPDESRSNPLLTCLNHNPEIDQYIIPI